MKRLPPWQTLYNSSIQDGIQEGHQLSNDPLDNIACLFLILCIKLVLK